jgi:hypothetical protein
MIVSPVIQVAINGELVPYQKIVNFKFDSSINDHLPSAWLGLADPDGDMISRFNIVLGTMVIINIIDGNEDDNQKHNMIKLSPFIVSKVFDGGEKNSSEVGGFIQLRLLHPWVFYNDMSPHAYSPMKISKLVKTIITDSTRGYELTVDDNYFGTTDDKGNYPRYKCGQSDYDFIINNLLPYATIGNNPVYFFINELGNIYFNTYKFLFNSGCKGMIVSDKANDNRDEFDTMGNIASNIGTENSIAFSKISINIGGEDSKDNLRKVLPKIYMEDLGTHNFLSGIKGPITKIASNTGDKMPFSFYMMASMGATDSVELVNRAFDDQFGLAVNNSKSLDSLFEITLSTAGFIGADMPTGSNVYLYVSPKNIDNNATTKKLSHWLTGKWVIGKSEHYTSRSGDPNSLVSTVTLVRPTFVIKSESDTTVEDSSLLWTV